MKKLNNFIVITNKLNLISCHFAVPVLIAHPLIPYCFSTQLLYISYITLSIFSIIRFYYSIILLYKETVLIFILLVLFFVILAFITFIICHKEC